MMTFNRFFQVSACFRAAFAIATLVAWASGAFMFSAWATGAQAASTPLGVVQLAAAGEDGPVTVFYPTATPEAPVQRGPFTLQLAVDAPPAVGNQRLVVISHGSGGTAWVHADLARALVSAGFTVAVPQHRGDNALDPSQPGPVSWKQRPAEASRAIDAVGRDARFAPHLKLDRVGFYGMSAGGHTGLSIAGGAWSPGLFKRHCEAHIAEDFQACVGLITSQQGNWLDGIKRWVALRVIGARFDDPTPQTHTDPRFAAVVVGVPFAADFDFTTLAQPRVPIGVITAGQDAWLIPRFHSDKLLQACRSCVRVAELPEAGHGALLSPPPSGLTGLAGAMLNDPPGFDRSRMREVDARIAAFLSQHLLP